MPQIPGMVLLAWARWQKPSSNSRVRGQDHRRRPLQVGARGKFHRLKTPVPLQRSLPLKWGGPTACPRGGGQLPPPPVPELLPANSKIWPIFTSNFQTRQIASMTRSRVLQPQPPAKRALRDFRRSRGLRCRRRGSSSKSGGTRTRTHRGRDLLEGRRRLRRRLAEGCSSSPPLVARRRRQRGRPLRGTSKRAAAAAPATGVGAEATRPQCEGRERGEGSQGVIARAPGNGCGLGGPLSHQLSTSFLL